MRTAIALSATALALVAAIAATPAGAIGISKTPNPGVPWYYPNPNAAATQRFEQVYNTCQVTHRQYGDRISVGGVKASTRP